MSKSYTRTFDCLVAFGANQGDTQTAFKTAETLLGESDAISELQSSMPMLTRAVTGDLKRDADANEYLNAAFRFETTLTPTALHAVLIEVEQTLGRRRKSRWGPRTIDLDLLLYADMQIDLPDLQVPHPRMSFRRFVLQPAMDVAADMVHPNSGMSIQQLLTHLDTREPVVLIATDDLKSVTEAISTLAADETVSLVIVDTATDFIRHSPTAMLSVSWFDDASESPLLRYAQNFCGPMLILSVADGVDRNLSEIAAAMAAMKRDGA